MALRDVAGPVVMAYRRRPGLPDENREPDLSPFRFKPIIPPGTDSGRTRSRCAWVAGTLELFEDYP